MDVRLIGVIVQPVVKLVMLITAETEQPSAFQATLPAHQNTLIALLNVRLGLVTQDIINPAVVVFWLVSLKPVNLGVLMAQNLAQMVVGVPELAVSRNAILILAPAVVIQTSVVLPDRPVPEQTLAADVMLVNLHQHLVLIIVQEAQEEVIAIVQEGLIAVFNQDTLAYLLYIKGRGSLLRAFFLSLYQSHFLGVDDGLGAIGGADGSQKSIDMQLHRCFRYTHFIGYLLVGQALGYEL